MARLGAGRCALRAAPVVVAGLGADWLASRLLQGLLFGVDAHDPLVFGAMALILIAVAAAASYFPARQATAVDPTLALRE